ncbi:MAG: ABC-three component system protein [Luteolibacter sp.]
MASRIYTALTLKRLYGLSGNCCAYPDCPCTLLYAEGNSSDICHIEALNPGGPRYNSDPVISDKERNDYPNLMLLCKTHHGIIDQTDDQGEPYYSVEQLKAMKQVHEDWFESSRAAIFNAKSPSLLARIVQSLSAHQGESKPNRGSHPFKIQEKIQFNEVSRHYGVIQKYSIYYHTLESLYNEFESSQKAALLESINDTYLASLRPSKSADDIWDDVETMLIEKIHAEANLEYSEQIEWCMKIIMVDAFMRCKILEHPEA